MSTMQLLVSLVAAALLLVWLYTSRAMYFGLRVLLDRGARRLWTPRDTRGALWLSAVWVASGAGVLACYTAVLSWYAPL